MRFHPHHRHSFFPLVIALLSLGLIVFMFYSFSYVPTDTPVDLSQPVVTIEDYRQSRAGIVKEFDQNVVETDDALSRLVVVEEALKDLLALRVPASEQNAHLELALILTSMRETLRSGDRDLSEPMQNWKTLTHTYGEN